MVQALDSINNRKNEADGRFSARIVYDPVASRAEHPIYFWSRSRICHFMGRATRFRSHSWQKRCLEGSTLWPQSVYYLWTVKELGISQEVFDSASLSWMSTSSTKFFWKGMIVGYHYCSLVHAKLFRSQHTPTTFEEQFMEVTIEAFHRLSNCFYENRLI